MDLEQARLKLTNLQRRICAFTHATALIYWDGETSAPAETAANRAFSTAVLNEMIFNLKNGEETVELLEYLNEERDQLSVRERRTVDFMMREINNRRLIPVDEYVAYETLRTKAQDAWHIATEENDFGLVSPYLEQMFDAQRSFAKHCRPEMHPYEYCLDTYEEGLTIQICDDVFDAIKTEISPLLQSITDKPQIDDRCLKGDFPAEKQESLAIYLMELMEVDMNRVGLATSEHPFSTFLGSHFDSRISTKYSRKDFTPSMYHVLHGIGHVLHDMGQEDNLAYTVLDGSASMALLESQGRFYENIIGRSRAFIEYIYPELVELFPDPVARFTPEDIYRAVNKVEPGPIRIESDELTSNLHNLVRYEIEKALIEGDLRAKDIPDAWAEKYKAYLNLDITDAVTGALQDIHWFFGAIGYFPNYVVGAAMGAQIVEKMNEDIDLEGCIKEANYPLINLWNRQNIWKHGGLYNSQYIMEKFVGTAFDSTPYINYLKNKYNDIYRW